MAKNFYIVTAGAGGAIFLLWREVGRDDERVADFLEKLETGVGITSEFDPRLALRRACTKRTTLRRVAFNHMALFLKAWNYTITGREIRRGLYFRKDELYPRVKVS